MCRNENKKWLSDKIMRIEENHNEMKQESFLKALKTPDNKELIHQY
jgi:hypothetical protein